MIKTCKFNGVRYTIDIDANLAGSCDNPNKHMPDIYINANIDTKEGLGVVIHEALHACNWSTAEDKVDQTATDLSNFLWRLGFRRVNKDIDKKQKK